jgi:hypothetical protein
VRSLKQLVETLSQSTENVDLGGMTICIFVALIASAIVALMYLLLYERKDLGSGVHKSFLILGPSVTAMFLAIQFSLPLSLGLLGALSFVRFRTPIKDPEEVSYILLLIATSVASATYNFGLAAIILAVALVAQLIYKKLSKGSFFLKRIGHVLISVSDNGVNERAITSVLASRLSNIRLKSIANKDGSVNLHYSFAADKQVPYDDITTGLNEISKVKSLNIVLDGQDI